MTELMHACQARSGLAFKPAVTNRSNLELNIFYKTMTEQCKCLSSGSGFRAGLQTPRRYEQIRVRHPLRQPSVGHRAFGHAFSPETKKVTLSELEKYGVRPAHSRPAGWGYIRPSVFPNVTTNSKESWNWRQVNILLKLTKKEQSGDHPFPGLPYTMNRE